MKPSRMPLLRILLNESNLQEVGKYCQHLWFDIQADTTQAGVPEVSPHHASYFSVDFCLHCEVAARLWFVALQE
jgi:hypothetical protein